MRPEPPLIEARFEVALDGAEKTGAEILARVYRHDRQALVALDDDMRALLPQFDTAVLPKKPEQILAGQTFIKSRTASIYVKSIDRSAAVIP